MKRSLFMLLLLISCLSNLKAQNEKFKALFIYNFTKYIEWPGTDPEFTIGIVGNSLIADELSIIAQKMKVGSKSIVIKKFSQASAVVRCQMVYVPQQMSGSLKEMSQRLSGQSILIISDGQSSLSNSGINFIEIDGKQKFEISKQYMSLHRLNVSSALYSLGKVVD